MRRERKASGTPVGGQFAPTSRQETNVEVDVVPVPQQVNPSMLTDQERSELKDATFLCPPYPRSAEQLLAFWENVKIPDDVIVTFMEAYLEEHQGNFKEWEAPRRMHSSQYRALVRLAKIREQAGWLPKSERERISGYSVEFPGHTVRSDFVHLHTFYRVDLIYPAWNVLNYDDEFHGPRMRERWREGHKKFRHDTRREAPPPL